MLRGCGVRLSYESNGEIAARDNLFFRHEIVPVAIFRDLQLWQSSRFIKTPAASAETN